LSVKFIKAAGLPENEALLSIEPKVTETEKVLKRLDQIF